MLNWRKFIVTGALATTLTFSSISALAVSFDDVSGNAGETSISKLVSLGIIVDKDTYFHPEDGLSRLEFAEISNRILTLSPAKALKIKDVTTTNGKNAAVLKAVNTGLLSLTKNGEFKPKSSINNGELAKALAYGLGFKKSWSNRPIDFLFFLERKGVLDIDTDLDAVVTREDAAVAIDKYMLAKDAYKTVTGVVAGLTPTGVSIKNDTGIKTYKLASNASIYLDAQAGQKGNLANGTAVELVLNNKFEVAYVSGAGLEVFDGNIFYEKGNLMFGPSDKATVKNFNLNAVIAPLPNNRTAAFTYSQFSNYSSKAGVSFGGTLYSDTITDQVTMIEAYISKVTDGSITVGSDSVTVDFSGAALRNQAFKFSADAKFSLVEKVKDEAGKETEKSKDVTLADIAALQAAGKVLTGTITAGADGTASALAVKAADPAPAK